VHRKDVGIRFETTLVRLLRLRRFCAKIRGACCDFVSACGQRPSAISPLRWRNREVGDRFTELKRPLLSAFLRLLGTASLVRPHCLAGDEVEIAPVSKGDSPLTGNFTGRIENLGLWARFGSKKPLFCSNLSRLTGKIFRRSANLELEQRIPSKNVTDEVQGYSNTCAS
jgi:hypothetical protein